MPSPTSSESDSRLSVPKPSYIRDPASRGLAGSNQVDLCRISIGPCKNLHAPGSSEARPGGVPGRLRLVCRGDARCDVATAVTPAPAQDVSRMLTTPPVHDFGCHLELRAVFAALPDQRP
jgi:hypothetical protein